MISRTIVASMALVGLSACSLAAEPRYYRMVPVLDAALPSEDRTAPIDVASFDVASFDVASFDAASFDASTVEASIADAVVTTDVGSVEDTADIDVPVDPRDVVSADGMGPPLAELFKMCASDTDCLRGTRCCRAIGHCMPTPTFDALCAAAAAPCGSNACPRGTLCCDGVTPPLCVRIDSYLEACPNRVCSSRERFPLGCPGTMTCCNDRCANTEIDVQHCGGCGNSCGSSQACDAGVCATCTGRTETDPNVANVRCCRPGGVVSCSPGRACCVPLPRL